MMKIKGMISILKNYVREPILNNLSEDMTEDLISLLESAESDGILEEGLKIFEEKFNNFDKNTYIPEVDPSYASYDIMKIYTLLDDSFLEVHRKTF